VLVRKFLSVGHSPPPQPAVAHARARLAGLHKRRNPDPEKVAEARAQLVAAIRDTEPDRYAAAIERLIAEAPPLTAEQRARLAVLLDGA
jgi:DNA-binding FadR family transcriptional regulator